jgi:hypothetical protein
MRSVRRDLRLLGQMYLRLRFLYTWLAMFSKALVAAERCWGARLVSSTVDRSRARISSQSTLANLPDESLVALSTSNVNETGVYYGFARITSFLGTNPISPEDGHVFPMIMLLGPSPFYKLKAVCLSLFFSFLH